MTWNFCTTETVTASKDYPCNACVWLRNADLRGELSFAELRKVALAKRDGWKIKKGQKYLKTTGKWDGDFDTVRSRPEIDDICRDHEVYEE